MACDRILRRHLHRPETIAFLRRERSRFRQAICASNEYHLAKVRSGENAMASVRACLALEQIEDGQVTKPTNTSLPGVTVRIVNVVQSPPAEQPIVDVAPRRAELLSQPIEPVPFDERGDPIFRPYCG
jgi:hypothetical protein